MIWIYLDQILHGDEPTISICSRPQWLHATPMLFGIRKARQEQFTDSGLDAICTDQDVTTPDSSTSKIKSDRL
jgi:hypothetical protein